MHELPGARERAGYGPSHAAVATQTRLKPDPEILAQRLREPGGPRRQSSWPSSSPGSTPASPDDKQRLEDTAAYLVTTPLP